VLCSVPEGLEFAYLNVTVLWAAIQILQSFITWINEPSQINHHTIDHFGSVKYAKLLVPVAENGSSK